VATIIKKAVAKVNLMLHITGRRGIFHEMQSIFTFVDSMFDVLKFDTSAEFSDNSAKISSIRNEDNLIHRARDFLISHDPNLFIPDVKIMKNIPRGSGLGGGSSDAALCIICIFVINGPVVDTRIEVAKSAHVLGMDVPVFLHRCMYGSNFLLLEGIGKFDEIKEIICKDNIQISVLNSESKLNTRAVFENYKDNFEEYRKIDICDLNFLINSKNSLQNTAISMCPEIALMLQGIKDTGATIARMSGSGSSCFGVYTS
jgi:4-diphosphocytidyl-2-C-methyl-D-erythritol kinase